MYVGGMVCHMWETLAAFQRPLSALRAFSIDVGAICVSSDAHSEIPNGLERMVKEVMLSFEMGYCAR